MEHSYCCDCLGLHIRSVFRQSFLDNFKDAFTKIELLESMLTGSLILVKASLKFEPPKMVFIRVHFCK
jgi:hypothetical protein